MALEVLEFSGTLGLLIDKTTKTAEVRMAMTGLPPASLKPSEDISDLKPATAVTTGLVRKKQVLIFNAHAHNMTMRYGTPSWS